MLLKIFDIMCAVKIFESSHTCFQCGNFAKSRFLLQGVPLEIVSFQMVRKVEQCISDLLLLKQKCEKIQSKIPCSLLHHTSLECKKELTP